MNNRELFLNVINHAVIELKKEIDRVALLTTAVSFTSSRKKYLTMEVALYVKGMVKADAERLLKDVDNALLVEDGCREIIRNDFTDINKMSFLAQFSVIEACLEDAFSHLIEANGGVALLVENGVLQPKWLNKEVSGNKAYDTARKNSKDGYSGFHLKLCECFSVNLSRYEEWSVMLDEMKEIRNCFLHRANRVDSKLIEVSERWEKEGELIKIGNELYRELMRSIGVFLTDLIYGFAGEYGRKVLDVHGFKDHF